MSTCSPQKLKYGKEYRTKNKKAIAKKQKARRCNPEANKIRRDRRNWRMKHDPEFRERRQKQMHEQEKRSLINNPNRKISKRLRTRMLKALKRVKGKKSKSFKDLLGCSIKHFMEYMEKLFKEGMSWDNHGGWHIDHIIPCASFDLTDPNQQIKCFHYTNLQPLWAEDNLRKKDKIQ